MKNYILALMLLGGLEAGGFKASAQTTNNSSTNTPPSPTEFLWTFSGLSYETNAAGNIIAKTISDKTMLAEAVAAANVSAEGKAVVYHINGSSFGDTVDIVSRTNGEVLQTLFGYFFGDDASLGRMAITNGKSTQVKEIDYIYTGQNSHSLGASLTSKTYVTNRNKTVDLVAEGPMHWLINPDGTNGARICTGTFITGKPLF